MNILTKLNMFINLVCCGYDLDNLKKNAWWHFHKYLTVFSVNMYDYVVEMHAKIYVILGTQKETSGKFKKTNCYTTKTTIPSKIIQRYTGKYVWN